MRNKVAVLVVLFFLLTSVGYLNAQSFENPGKFATEFLFGLRLPMGVTRDDILSGFSIRGGVGYQMTRNWELFHIAFDFGNSSPHDPQWVAFYDWYTYSTYLQQEIVNVYGFPLTTRYRFKIQEQLEIYFGAGVAYYWFRTRLDHPYLGEIKPARRRHGPGGIFEAGIYTDAFSDNMLVGLTSNILFLKTHGETLTTPKADNVEEINEKVTRKDFYLTIGISLRYYMGNE